MQYVRWLSIGLASIAAIGATACRPSIVQIESSEIQTVDTTIPLVEKITSISGGEAFICAVIDGAAWCWGQGRDGRLGNGEEVNVAHPARVLGLESGVTQISALYRHVCAIKDGGVWCWGLNGNGELGNGSTGWGQFEATPVPVVGLETGVTSIAAGDGSSCAVKDNKLYCWGDNSGGQLGDGTQDASLTPKEVTALGNQVTAVSMGYNYACAILVGGKLKCWGENWAGNVGNGTFDDIYTPTDVIGMESGVTMVVGSDWSTTCAIKNGGVYCWGERNAIGDGFRQDRAEPTPVVGLSSGVIEIDVGGGNGCALLNTGAVKCWGSNQNDSLGVYSSDLSRSDVPLAIGGLEAGVTRIGAADDINCAAHLGQLKCWGNNYAGGLGDGSVPKLVAPQAIAVPLAGISSMNLGLKASCAVTASGSKCWGSDFVDLSTKKLDQPMPDLGAPITSVSVARDFGCAISAGRLFCWGNNDSGQLGNGVVGGTSIDPTEVAAFSAGGVTQVAVYNNYACAIKAGNVWCWGNDYYGNLGIGAPWDTNANAYCDEDCNVSTPTQIAGLAGVTQLSLSYDHACALVGDAVKCWGHDSFFCSLRSPVPLDIPTLNQDVLSLSSGDGFTCARKLDGSVVCFGANNYNLSALGNPVAVNCETTPVVVPGVTGVTDLASAQSATCAVLGDGTVKCWGYNWNAELGRGSSLPNEDANADLALVSGPVDKLYSGISTSTFCAVLQNGIVECWGKNEYSQAGIYSLPSSPMPLTVSADW